MIPCSVMSVCFRNLNKCLLFVVFWCVCVFCFFVFVFLTVCKIYILDLLLVPVNPVGIMYFSLP